MKTYNSFKRRFGIGVLPPAQEIELKSTLTETKDAAFREAGGVTIDKDEDSWRPLTGEPNRDLSPLTQQRMQEIAVYLWRGNLLAKQLIELPVAYLLAEGVRLQVKDEDAQKWLDAFWNDPINRMGIKLERKVRELAVFGEQCWPVFVNEFSGHVRLGYLDPGTIATVVIDPDGGEQPIGVVTVKDKQGRARRYKVIVNGDDEELFTERARKIRETFTDGECFYFAVNQLSKSSRGTSDLLASADWLDVYEQFLFGEGERANFLRAWVYDVELKGATPEEVEQRAKKISAPKPGSVRVHNDAEAWSVVQPELQAADMSAGARLFRNHILGGNAIPEHWFGGGGDVNRATAGEMGEPTFKTLSMRQSLWKEILEEVGTFVVRQRLDRDAGGAPKVGEPLPDDYAVAAVFPEMTARDTTKYAQALQQVAAAAVLAIGNGLLTEETAVKLLSAIAGRLGVEIDPAEELRKARREAGKRSEADTLVDPPNDEAGEQRIVAAAE